MVFFVDTLFLMKCVDVLACLIVVVVVVVVLGLVFYFEMK